MLYSTFTKTSMIDSWITSTISNSRKVIALTSLLNAAKNCQNWLKTRVDMEVKDGVHMAMAVTLVPAAKAAAVAAMGAEVMEAAVAASEVETAEAAAVVAEEQIEEIEEIEGTEAMTEEVIEAKEADQTGDQVVVVETSGVEVKVAHGDLNLLPTHLNLNNNDMTTGKAAMTGIREAVDVVPVEEALITLLLVHLHDQVPTQLPSRTQAGHPSMRAPLITLKTSNRTLPKRR